MKNTQIKNLHIATTLLEGVLLENEISVTEKIIQDLNTKVALLKKRAQVLNATNESSGTFQNVQKEKTSSVVFKIKAYTKKELRQLYGINERRFRSLLQSVPETKNTGRMNWLTPKQVEAVIRTHGIPGEVEFQ